MEIFRRVDSASSAAGAVLLILARHADGNVLGSVTWPARAEIPAGHAGPSPLAQALAAARSARQRGGFAEIAVKLPADVPWQEEWGNLQPEAAGLSEPEAYELASATETGRDA